MPPFPHVGLCSKGADHGSQLKPVLYFANGRWNSMTRVALPWLLATARFQRDRDSGIRQERLVVETETCEKDADPAATRRAVALFRSPHFGPCSTPCSAQVFVKCSFLGFVDLAINFILSHRVGHFAWIIGIFETERAIGRASAQADGN